MEMHNFNLFPRSTIPNIFNDEYDKRLKELSSDVCVIRLGAQSFYLCKRRQKV